MESRVAAVTVSLSDLVEAGQDPFELLIAVEM